MATTESVSELRDQIHRALKMWHSSGTGAGPLADWQLFRQARLEATGSGREVTNKILLEGLNALAVDHQIDANLLRKRFLDGLAMHVVANQLNLSEASAYRKQQQALNRLALILQAGENRAREACRCTLEARLEPSTYVQLVGVEPHLDRLLDLLASTDPPWLVLIAGLGGLGKTSLADALARRVIDRGLFDDLGWVSARQEIFNPGGAIRPVAVPALTAADLVEKLAAQLMPDLAGSASVSFEEKSAALRVRLKQSFHLIVVDNLETVLDLESLLPTLRSLAGPTRFLLTSRQSLHYEPGLYHFDLPALDEANAVRLIRNEAELHNLPHLQSASDDALRRIYRTVGGNPLALRLVVGQTHVHPLDMILTDLAAARGRNVERLYTFIYRRAWEALAEPARQVFLAMPLVSRAGGSLDYLVDMTGLEPGQVGDALLQLTALNLVNSRGDLTERRYTIHNLTRTFLQEQVAQWQ